MTLVYLNELPGNQFLSSPRLTDTRLGYDIFSHELGVLSQRLKKLVLDGAVLSLTDFFKANAQQHWPWLEELELVHQASASADGSWYFTLDPRMSMEEYLENETDPDARTLDYMREQMDEDHLPPAVDVPLNVFRTATDPAKFKEIYLAAAEAVKRMPILRCLEIWFNVQGSCSFGQGEHEFRYLSGQGQRKGRDAWCKSSTAELRVGWGLIPTIELDAEVLQAWRGVGAAKGNASIELLLRDDFDYDDFKVIQE